MTSTKPIVDSITPSALYERFEAGCTVDLIDVRTPTEFREVHAMMARSLPLDGLRPETVPASREGAEGGPLYVICRSGDRGRIACEKMLAWGRGPIVNVEGGTLAWEQAGLPLVRGKKAISLERQVRIAAGSLVLLATILGAFVHPVFLGLSGFVGAGLVFAGVTDTCGMAMLLARMPWNRRGSDQERAIGNE